MENFLKIKVGRGKTKLCEKEISYGHPQQKVGKSQEVSGMESLFFFNLEQNIVAIFHSLILDCFFPNASSLFCSIRKVLIG